MLHISGGEGRITGKFNSDNGTGYLISEGQGEELRSEEWVDFTWFGEKSSILSIKERKRVKEQREARGMMARVHRGYGSLQFSYNAGGIEAAVIFHGQGKGMDQWFRGPKYITQYRTPPSFIYRRSLIDLQKRWNRQDRAPAQPSGARMPGNEDEWKSDDESVLEVGAMDWEVIGARKDSMFSNRPQYSNNSRHADTPVDLRGLREWTEQTSPRELKELKELKRWEESKTPDELDRLRHLKNWEERNGFKGLSNSMSNGPGAASASVMMGPYVVTGGEWPRLRY
jgi:hypothetical protein